jgi:hypothetical protein
MIQLGMVFRETMLATKRIVEHPKDEEFPSQCEAVAIPLGFMIGVDWYETDRAALRNFWRCVLIRRWEDKSKDTSRWQNLSDKDTDWQVETCHRRFLLASEQLADQHELKDVRAFAPALFSISKVIVEQWRSPLEPVITQLVGPGSRCGRPRAPSCARARQIYLGDARGQRLRARDYPPHHQKGALRKSGHWESLPTSSLRSPRARAASTR